jgi:hypothetical protein
MQCVDCHFGDIKIEVGRERRRRSREPKEGKQPILDSRGGGCETHRLICSFFSVFGMLRQTEQAFLIHNIVASVIL